MTPEESQLSPRLRAMSLEESWLSLRLMALSLGESRHSLGVTKDELECLQGIWDRNYIPRSPQNSSSPPYRKLENERNQFESWKLEEMYSEILSRPCCYQWKDQIQIFGGQCQPRYASFSFLFFGKNLAIFTFSILDRFYKYLMCAV